MHVHATQAKKSMHSPTSVDMYVSICTACMKCMAYYNLKCMHMCGQIYKQDTCTNIDRILLCQTIHVYIRVCIQTKCIVAQNHLAYNIIHVMLHCIIVILVDDQKTKVVWIKYKLGLIRPFIQQSYGVAIT